MGERPPGKSIDRKDNNKGYFKRNCKWSTIMEQAQNRSNNKVPGGLRELCRKRDLPYWRIRKRIDRGWTLKQALNQPNTIRLIEVNGNLLPINKAAKLKGIHWRTLRWRITKEWPKQRWFE